VRAQFGFLLAFVALAATGCGTGGVAKSGDVAHGKQLFSATCASCHTLADAGAKGTIGPNLDYAFGSDKAQGFKEVTIRQVVADQIKFAGNYGPTGPTMPRNLVKGQDVDDVAAYVASVAALNAKPGTPAPAATPPASAGGGGGSSSALAAGKKAFSDNGCGACHTLAAAGTSGKIGPDLDKLKSYAAAAHVPLEQFIRESIVKPNAYVEKGFPQGVMPQTFGSLPKSTLDALVKFLAASAKG
jgi:cytochrome c oxidase subunit 2